MSNEKPIEYQPKARLNANPTLFLSAAGALFLPRGGAPSLSLQPAPIEEASARPGPVVSLALLLRPQTETTRRAGNYSGMGTKHCPTLERLINFQFHERWH